MKPIETTICKPGFAWLDEDDDLIWAWAEDFAGIDPADRPPGCTPVIIEVSPSEEWYESKQQEYDYLGGLTKKLNQFSEEITKLEKTIKAGE
jgi:hypothetical protein